MKRLLSAFLCLVLLFSLTACAATGNPQDSQPSVYINANTKAMGRWVESETILGENLRFSSAPVCLDDGTLWLFALDAPDENAQQMQLNLKTHKFVSKNNGGTWEEEALNWNTVTKGIITQVTVATDGTAFFQSIGEDAITSWMQKPGEDLKLIDLSGMNITYFLLLDSSTLFLIENVPQEGTPAPDRRCCLYDLSSGQVTTTPDNLSDLIYDSLYNAAIGKDKAGNPLLYFMGYTDGGRVLTTLDKNGSITAVFNSVPNAGDSNGAAADANGNYYYESPNGIFRIARGGSISEKILDSTGFTISMSSYYCNGLCQTRNGDFIVTLFSDSFQTKLLRYHWDESLPAASGDALTIWSFQDNATVRSAIVEFRKKHPESDINYIIATADSALSLDNILQALNAEMLTGGGPDVLILDNIDYQSYAKQGLLADLSQAIDMSKLQQNIVAPFITNGVAYVLPARFSVPVLYGETGTVESLTTLDALKSAILACKPRPDVNYNDDSYYSDLTKEEQYGLGFISIAQLLHFTLQSSASALIKDNQLDTGAVREVLSFVQEIGTYYGMKDYRPDQPSNQVTMGGRAGDVVSTGDGGYEYFVTMHARYGWDVMQTPSLLSYIGTVNTEGNAIGNNAVVQPGLSENTYLPLTLAGVNSSSDKKDDAFTFMQVLFGEDVQTAYQQDGSPVLQSALEHSEQSSQSEAKHFKGDIKALYASLKTPVLVSPIVEEKMLAHATALINGSETLDAAVTGVQNDLSLYLAEKE